jgi:hypothetical protein
MNSKKNNDRMRPTVTIDGKHYRTEFGAMTDKTFELRVTEKDSGITLDITGKCSAGMAASAAGIVADYPDLMVDDACAGKDPASGPATYVGKGGLLRGECTVSAKPVGDIREKCARRDAQIEEGE